MAQMLSDSEIAEIERNGIVVDEETAEIIAAARWGTSNLTLTPEIMRQLKDGKVWVYSDGEYTTLIRLGDKPFWKREYGRKEA